MSKFYLIGTSTDEKEIGVYHQIFNMGEECHNGLNGPRSMKNLVSWRFPEQPPQLDYLIMAKRAKLTDVLSVGFISARGYLVSERLKQLLEGFNLMPHRFYPGKVEYKGTLFNYYFLHLVCDSYRLIDFEKTKFYITTSGVKTNDNLIIKYEEDLKKMRKEMPMSKSIKAEKLYFSTFFENQPLDLFYFIGLHPDIFISEKLKTALEVMDITGLNIKEQNIISEIK